MSHLVRKTIHFSCGFFIVLKVHSPTELLPYPSCQVINNDQHCFPRARHNNKQRLLLFSTVAVFCCVWRSKDSKYFNSIVAKDTRILGGPKSPIMMPASVSMVILPQPLNLSLEFADSELVLYQKSSCQK